VVVVAVRGQRVDDSPRPKSGTQTCRGRHATGTESSVSWLFAGPTTKASPAGSPIGPSDPPTAAAPRCRPGVASPFRLHPAKIRSAAVRRFDIHIDTRLGAAAGPATGQDPPTDPQAAEQDSGRRQSSVPNKAPRGRRGGGRNSSRPTGVPVPPSFRKAVRIRRTTPENTCPRAGAHVRTGQIRSRRKSRSGRRDLQMACAAVGERRPAGKRSAFAPP